MLQDGTGGKAHITGFHVEFKDVGTSQDRLRGLDRDGGKREEWFPQRRYSDWSVIAYPRRGIALLDVREQRDRIPYALLTTPDRLGRMLNGMEDRAPRIEDIRDEFDRMSREVEIGTVTISLTKKDLEPRGGGSRFEDDYRFRARRDIDRGDIRYGAGNAGSVYISASIYFRDGRDDNHVEVSAQLNGKNERGRSPLSVRVKGT